MLEAKEPSDPEARAARPSDPQRPARRARPKDAASLILIDRIGDAVKVLVGRRHHRHVFMPNTYVFPGGRRDRADSRTAVAADLHPAVAAKLLEHVPASTPESRARALAVAALRETREETGLALATCDRDSHGPSLSALRFFARAITPPPAGRRYDTRFFACFTDETGVDPEAVRDSDELQDLRWIPLDPLPDIDLPDITRLILSDLRTALAGDGGLHPGRPVPFYHFHSGRRIRQLL